MRIDLQIFKFYFLVNLMMISQGLSAKESDKAQSATTVIAQPLSTSYLLQFTLGLIVVLMAVFLLVWLLRRIGRFQSSAEIDTAHSRHVPE